MTPEKRDDIALRLNEITRELERLELAPGAQPNPTAVLKLRNEQAELECSLNSGGPNPLS